MTWKYSLLLCALSFASLMVSFETEVFTSDEMQFIYSFAICTFSIICKKKIVYSEVMKIYPFVFFE